MGGKFIQSLNDAFTATVELGISIVAAAGNSNEDACNGSPSGAPGVITVGGSEMDDSLVSNSDWGECVDLCAPGSDIYSTWKDNSYGKMGGTSVSSPHVAGIVALLRGRYPQSSPMDIRNMLLKMSTKGVLKNLRGKTANRLAHVSC
eukprot:TRINITY_DN5540_c0_g1_i1.p1 TRINITY_DN5540_c0_g1~~TRINITY_DN5540_c0_g1_i1.p1  ORF type:complete len:147 (-),score=32.28 TRINITY_DN5540_c0_g1_i1:28-468(-)